MQRDGQKTKWVVDLVAKVDEHYRDSMEQQRTQIVSAGAAPAVLLGQLGFSLPASYESLLGQPGCCSVFDGCNPQPSSVLQRHVRQSFMLLVCVQQADLQQQLAQLHSTSTSRIQRLEGEVRGAKQLQDSRQ
jgi:hypothetical protein